MIDQKQLENVEYVHYLGSMITSDAIHTHEINPGLHGKSSISKRTRFTSKLDLNLMKKPVKCYIWNIALYGAQTWTFQKVDHKYLESLKCGAREGWRGSVGLIM